ncbi:MAG: lipopolysaccharide biosynthesis protein, partial [Geobacter sp.]
KGFVLTGSTPECFRIHLKNILLQVASKAREKRIVMLKSWNEWAEGNYVEPDQKFGHGYLDIIRDEIIRYDKIINK